VIFLIHESLQFTSKEIYQKPQKLLEIYKSI